MHNSPHIALIFVHYFTPKLLETALLSVIADLENEHYQYEIMVVNNGGDLNDLSDKIAFQNIVKWIHPLTNTGYAGGVNLGISKSNADYFIISNPDVLFCAGAIKALVEPLVKGQAVATGPQLFLDKKKQFKLPPLEPFTATAILLRQLAPYSHIFAKYWRKRWQRDTYQHWLATKPINSYQLSGAVMGIERGVWEELDGFDEKYPLYFEETDWLMRLKKSKQAALFIPNAEVIHFYNQSAAHEKRAAEWYRVSERRFFKKHFSRLFLYPLRLLTKILRKLSSAEKEPHSQTEDNYHYILRNIEQHYKAGNRHLEISLSPIGVPAAAMLLHPEIGTQEEVIHLIKMYRKEGFYINQGK